MNTKTDDSYWVDPAKTDQFNRERTLRLIESERILKKVFDRTPKHYDKETVLRSIFRALIQPDRAMMDKYRKTHQE